MDERAGWLLAGVLAATVLAAAAIAAAALVAADGGDEPDAPLAGDVVRGAAVFERAGCASCHTLSAARARGTRGPDLDRHLRVHGEPGHVVARIRRGGAGMPAFEQRLTDAEIRDVAAFVLASARAG